MQHKTISLILIAVLLVTSFGLVGAASAQAPTGTVNTGALNIRSGPGISYGVITYVYRSTVVTLLARNADSTWVKVLTSGGVQGWCNARYISTAYPISSLPVEGGTGSTYTGSVTSYGLNMRTGPGTSYAVVTSLPRGTVFTLLARDAAATWVKIQIADGRQGWVHSGFISTNIMITILPVEGGTIPTHPQHPVTGHMSSSPAKTCSASRCGTA
jgi:N-acetylmuramoyl-L-alanine amidase